MEQNNYTRFLGKQIRLILTFSSGPPINYQGKLIAVDTDSLLIDDRRQGYMVIRFKDISQIIEVQ